MTIFIDTVNIGEIKKANEQGVIDGVTPDPSLILKEGREFNCSLVKSMQMLFQTWVTHEELYQRLDSIDDSLLWGDIYAKF